MAGQKIVLTDVNFGDDTLPILRDDALLSSGSLLLVDFGHSYGRVAALPASNSTLYNIAWQYASDILGEGDTTTLAGVFTNNSQAADAIYELTGKGAVHAIYSQVNNSAINRGGGVKVPRLLRDYITESKTHTYYASVWSRRTRAALNTVLRQFEIGTADTYILSMNGAGLAAKRNTVSTAVGGANAVANRFAAVSGNALETDTMPDPQWPWGHNFGNSGSQVSLLNVSPSDILYRLYIEDLTVSGRTHAEVVALDQAAWYAAFAVGGKYYGDTWTDPATFP